MLKLKSAAILLMTILFASQIAFASKGDDFLDQVEAIRNINYRNGSFDERLYKYKSNFFKMHNFTLNYGSKILDKISKDGELTGHELNLIHETLSTYSFLAKHSNDFLKEMAPKKKSQFLTSPELSSLKKNLEWLSFKTLLLQHFKNTYMIFYKNKYLRRIIKNQIRTEAYQLEIFHDVADTVLNRKFRRNLELALKIFISKEELIDRESKLMSYSRSIKASIAYQLVKSKKGLKDFASQEGLRANPFDNLSNAVTSVTSGLSYSFGTIAGNITWRKGYLNNNQEAFQQISENLQPLDLLFEKRGFVFTDLTIPGNWGHVAVWLGSEEQLRERGLWDTPEIEPFQDKIQKGHNIFQVRRWGLEFDKLENFMKLDEISIVRHKNLLNRKQDSITRVFKNLFQQIGKNYDFSFDAMTTNEITCTEIITLSYGDIQWPTNYTLGRVTIAPDDMAKLVLYKNTPFSLIKYLRGQESGELLQLDNIEYAKVMGYKTSSKNDVSVYEKLENICEEAEVLDENGRRKLKKRCQEKLVQPVYKGSIL
jgi:hypothetical protein